MPKKSDPYFTRTRTSHTSKLDWVIIDLSAFNVRIASEKPGHQGEFLDRLIQDDAYHLRHGGVPRISVGRAFGATTGLQARYFAANGQTADEFKKRKGRKKATYGDQVRYAAVETRVLQHLLATCRIDWNLDAVRRELFEAHGEDVLWHLCARFHPNGPIPGSEAALSAELRRKTSTTFKIVDLDEFRSTVARARDGLKGRRTIVRVHEGKLLMAATTIGKITTKFAWRAEQIYLERVQGAMNILPHGRFMAVPEFQWDEYIRQESLPEFDPVTPPSEASGAPETSFRLEPDDGPPPARASGTRLRIVRRPSRNPVEQQKLPFGA